MTYWVATASSGVPGGIVNSATRGTSSALAAAAEGPQSGRATERAQGALHGLAGPRVEGPRSGEGPHEAVDLAAEVLAQVGDRLLAEHGVEGVARERASDEAEATQAPLDGEGAVEPGRADLAALVAALGLGLGVEGEVEGVRAEAGAEDGPRGAAEPAGAADDQPVAAGSFGRTLGDRGEDAVDQSLGADLGADRVEVARVNDVAHGRDEPELKAWDRELHGDPRVPQVSARRRAECPSACSW
jgi:hypothetical protein